VPVKRLPLLGAREHELDGAARLPRERRGYRLRPHERLRPEGAPHRRHDHPHSFRGEPEDARQLLAEVERRLCAREHLEPVAVPAGDAGVRFHRGMLRGGRPIRLLHDHVRLRPGGIDVAVVELEAVTHVGPGLGAHPEVRRAAGGESDLIVDEPSARSDRVDHVEDGRHLLVVDLDESGGLLRRARCLAGDGCHDVADIPHAVEREHGLVLDLHAVAPEPANVVRDQRNAISLDGARVDGDHPRMRKRRTDEPGVQLAVEVDVLRVLCGAGDAGIGHATSSRARRTSTSITHRR
jgi:hypothetical protein